MSITAAEPSLEAPRDVPTSTGSWSSTRKVGTSCDTGDTLHRSPCASEAASASQVAQQEVVKIHFSATESRAGWVCSTAVLCLRQPTRMLSARDFREE